MTVAFPVLVLEKDSGDVMRFDSLAEMQSYLERIDVENGEYLAWVASGHSVKMTVQEPFWLKLEPGTDEADTPGLFGVLQRFGEARGVKVDVGDRNTAQLDLYEKIIAQSPPRKSSFLGKFFKSPRR
jgi:hypothetical protein